ncbi:MAG: response regulator [Chitinophagaceae bacterium]|nr:response regulator [Chitinophagaceae bacterium]
MDNVAVKIILADDDESDRLIFIEAFSEIRIKADVVALHDGKQLMEYLDKNKVDLPAIIFLDLNMPRKTGVECLKEIRATKKYKSIPIAIYSTSSSKNDIEESFHNGANVYLKKPSDFNKLKEALYKVVSSANPFLEPIFNIDNFLMKV